MGGPALGRSSAMMAGCSRPAAQVWAYQAQVVPSTGWEARPPNQQTALPMWERSCTPHHRARTRSPCNADRAYNAEGRSSGPRHPQSASWQTHGRWIAEGHRMSRRLTMGRGTAKDLAAPPV